MTPNKIKTLNCANCKSYCVPRTDFPLGTCMAATTWQHGLHQIDQCPIVVKLIEEASYAD